MYRQPSKRQQLIRRVVVYSIMSAAVLALVTGLIFVMLGYQFNRNDGKIEQGGLVQFDSKPTGATVTIDGASFGSQTTSKATLTAGQHFITMQKEGYKPWQKAVTVVPGAVLWLNYARLVPNDNKPLSVAQFATVSSAISSPDDKWMAIKEDAATPIIQLADLSQEMPKITSLELPAASYTHPSAGKTQSFTLEKWDPDSRFVVVKHVYDDTQMEWLVVNSSNGNDTKNVTKLLDVPISKLLFNENNPSLLYVLTGADVRKIDLNAATLSRPLVTNVADFSLYDKSTITYTTLLDQTSKTRSVGYYQDGADASQIIKTYQDDGHLPLTIRIDKYFSDTYVALNYGEAVDVLKGKLPTKDSQGSLKRVTTFIVSGGAQYLSFKTNGRFIVAQNGPAIKLYDVELQKTTATMLKGVTAVTHEVTWLDDYMLWSDGGGILRFYEFDGANQHDIMPITSGLSVSLSPNSKYVYGILKGSDNIYHLQRLQLIN